MKQIVIFLFFLIFLFLVIAVYHKVDDDNIHLLPPSQKVTSGVKHIESPHKATLDHIVIILMENKPYNAIVDNSNAPYINSLIKKYSFADNYFAVSHPSLPNYIAIIGGSTFGITSDCTDCYVHATNLIDQLEEAKKTWKAYMESMPSNCFQGSSENYAQKHDPFIYFDDIRTTPSRCNRIVPYSNISSDFSSVSTTPNFAWITPNLCDDMHDCSVQTGDRWLTQHVPYILASTAFTGQNSLLIITWDEGEDNGSNQVPTLFLGNSVKKGFVTHVHYTHYSLLHTIEEIWNLPPLTANVEQSNGIMDIFNK